MPTPRSLAEDLRGRDDEQLAALLRARPDLVHPLPADLGNLAARSVTAASTARAVNRLDAFTLQVLEAAALLEDPFDDRSVFALMRSPQSDVAAAIDRLVTPALIWGPPSSRHVTATAREVLGPWPAGLAPAWRVLAPGRAPPVDEAVHGLLAEAPDAARRLLEHLDGGVPLGGVERADRTVSPRGARSPVDWLLAHELLLAFDAHTVVLPREVALVLRGGFVHETEMVVPPKPDETVHDQRSVDEQAAGAAAAFVRRVDELLHTWSSGGPPVLRSGGLGVRELKSAAGRLDTDERVAALIIEVSYAAGLLGRSGDADDRWLPTVDFDRWREQTSALRWLVLVRAWLVSTRAAGLGGSRDDRGQRRNTLGDDVDLGTAPPDVRRAVLHDLSALPPGHGATASSLVARERFKLPRSGAIRDDLVRWTLDEAVALGVCASTAITSYGRALVADDDSSAARLLGSLLPVPVGHVLLQADLTAIAPGPLQPELAQELALVADVESTGGATVYRFNSASIRRALDVGRVASDIHELLRTHSRTPVPQALTYLIEDVARRHGHLRVGAATSFVRSDDASSLDELLAEPRAAGLRLRRLAPTVAATATPVDLVVDRLRALGMSPVAEGDDGALALTASTQQRSPRRIGSAARMSELDERSAATSVQAMRLGEEAARARQEVRGPAGSPLPRRAIAETMDLLREAIASGASVRLGYLGEDGTTQDRVVDPLDVRTGRLRAYDHRAGNERTFAVHRVTGIALLDERPSRPQL